MNACNTDNIFHYNSSVIEMDDCYCSLLYRLVPKCIHNCCHVIIQLKDYVLCVASVIIIIIFFLPDMTHRNTLLFSNCTNESMNYYVRRTDQFYIKYIIHKSTEYTNQKFKTLPSFLWRIFSHTHKYNHNLRFYACYLSMIYAECTFTVFY